MDRRSYGVTDYRYYAETRGAAWKAALALPSYTSYDSLPMSLYLFPLPIADCKRSLLDTYFMYIYLLISIDLQLSRLCNSFTLQSLHIAILLFLASYRF